MRAKQWEQYFLRPTFHRADELRVRRLNIRGVRRRGRGRRRGIGLYLDSFQSVSDFLASFFSRTPPPFARIRFEPIDRENNERNDGIKNKGNVVGNVAHETFEKIVSKYARQGNAAVGHVQGLSHNSTFIEQWAAVTIGT